MALGRRMRKSTLLRRLETELKTKISLHSSELLIIPIYVDGLSLPRPLSASVDLTRKIILNQINNIIHLNQYVKNSDSDNEINERGNFHPRRICFSGSRK